jgi:hypothetical protein
MIVLMPALAIQAAASNLFDYYFLLKLGKGLLTLLGRLQ